MAPNQGGRCRQAHPLVNTNTMAVNTARSSTRDVPQPCGCGFASGISGSTNMRNPSGTDHDLARAVKEDPIETRSKTAFYNNVLEKVASRYRGVKEFVTAT
nr:hypothetical protein [Microtetraspora sp. NBRC 16547]